MSLKQLIQKKVIHVVNEEFENAEIYLFGSQATNKSTADSDWDLLILLDVPTLSFDLETRLMNKLFDIELETNQIISPLIYSKSKWTDTQSLSPLFNNIKNEGVRIQ